MKTIVLDDDPTGTQTVYDLPVLTEWTVATLQAEFARGTPIFYILTNSRSLPLPAAQMRARLLVGGVHGDADGAGGDDCRPRGRDHHGVRRGQRRLQRHGERRHRR